MFLLLSPKDHQSVYHFYCNGFYKTWNLFLTSSLKSYFALLVLNFPMSNFLMVDLGVTFINFNFMMAVTKWWSLPISAPRLALTSWSDLFHFPLMAMWSIWFLSLPPGDTQVSLCTSLCGKNVVISTKFSKLFPILINDATVISTHYSFISCVVTFYFCIKDSHNDCRILFWNLL